jgi:hypothetical protein
MVQEKEVIPGKFVWQCDLCGWEYPKISVPKHQLPPCPDHECRGPNPVFG